MAFVKTASLLKNTGAIGLFWNRPDETNAPYRPAFDAAYNRYARQISEPWAEDLLENWIERKRTEIESSGLFGPVVVRRYPWTLTYDTERYLELLSTYSDHVLLPEPSRSGLFESVRGAIEELGGSILKKYLTVLFFAKRTQVGG
jgi:hypothetical protein